MNNKGNSVFAKNIHFNEGWIANTDIFDEIRHMLEDKPHSKLSDVTDSG